MADDNTTGTGRGSGDLRCADTAVNLHRSLLKAYRAIAANKPRAAEHHRVLIADCEQRIRQTTDARRDLSRHAAVAAATRASGDLDPVRGAVGDQLARTWRQQLTTTGDPRRAAEDTAATAANRLPTDGDHNPTQTRLQRSAAADTIRQWSTDAEAALAAPRLIGVHLADWHRCGTDLAVNLAAPWPQQLRAHGRGVALTAVVDHTIAAVLCDTRRPDSANAPERFDVGDVTVEAAWDLVATAVALHDGDLDAQQAWDAAVLLAAERP